jgi:hypothetical protein
LSGPDPANRVVLLQFANMDAVNVRIPIKLC